MDQNLIAIAVWTVVSTLVGALVAVLLNRNAAGRSRWLRTLISTAFALLPDMLLTVVVLISPGEPLALILSMSPDEFLIPFALQLAIVLVISLPLMWTISGRVPEGRHEADVFE